MSSRDFLRAGGSGRPFLRGFTLVELAMVLFIVALLLGGLLVPLATQLEGRQRSEAQIELQEIRESLIGYAISNDGNLPCYADSTDGVAENLNPCVADPDEDQYLPWSTLGLENGVDPWNQYWRYRVDRNFVTPSTVTISATVHSYMVGPDKEFDDIEIRELDSENSAEGAPVYKSLTSTEYPIAVIYSMGANQTADYENLDYEATENPSDPDYDASDPDLVYEAGPVSNLDRDADGEEDSDKFDDLLIWLSRPLLFYKLVNAEVLP